MTARAASTRRLATVGLAVSLALAGCTSGDGGQSPSPSASTGLTSIDRAVVDRAVSMWTGSTGRTAASEVSITQPDEQPLAAIDFIVAESSGTQTWGVRLTGKAPWTLYGPTTATDYPEPLPVPLTVLDLPGALTWRDKQASLLTDCGQARLRAWATFSGQAVWETGCKHEVGDPKPVVTRIAGRDIMVSDNATSEHAVDIAMAMLDLYGTKSTMNDLKFTRGRGMATGSSEVVWADGKVPGAGQQFSQATLVGSVGSPRFTSGKGSTVPGQTFTTTEITKDKLLKALAAADKKAGVAETSAVTATVVKQNGRLVLKAIHGGSTETIVPL